MKQLITLISKCSKLAQKECKTRYDLDGEGDPLGIMPEIYTILPNSEIILILYHGKAANYQHKEK